MFFTEFLKSAFLLSFFGIISCSNPSYNEKIINQLNASLEESNKSFAQSNQDIVYALENRTTDIKAKEKVANWLPKAKKLSVIAKAEVDYLEKLKQKISNRPANEKKLSKQFLENDAEVKQLFKQITAYWQDLLSVDAKLKEQIGVEVEKMNRLTIAVSNQAELEKTYLTSVAPQEVIAFLAGLENTVIRTENKCLLFCLDQTRTIWLCDFEANEALVAQNAQILKAGDELEITAGMGSFKNTKMPKITIGNKVVELNDHNLAVHKFKTSKKLGKNSLPVKVEFIDQDGRPQERTFNVEYTLVEEIKK